eukprot:NODE_6393_length_1676_cov_2.198838.p1 GENE.NODE_6393_length_1676_cov_2.198838~~NODE_6393_length_1676_cov_2.198838.p1  ORF type:complete len:547 (+),score=89.87 NODE_6393_length_1676_cov_2.198838:2-1642(+)
MGVKRTVDEGSSDASGTPTSQIGWSDRAGERTRHAGSERGGEQESERESKRESKSELAGECMSEHGGVGDGFFAQSGIRFLVALIADCPDVLGRGAEHAELDTGPARLRLLGSTEALGCLNGVGNPQDGVDLFWEGDGWASVVVPVTPHTPIAFEVLRVDQPESHPGVLQGYRRIEVHAAREYIRGARHLIRTAAEDEVLEVRLRSDRLACGDDPPTTRVVPRLQAFACAPLAPTLLPACGRMRCQTFDTRLRLGCRAPPLHFCLYLPPGYHQTSAPSAPACPEGGSRDSGVASSNSKSTGKWPLLFFLHSMHGRLNGDNNLFFESDTPLRLLLGDAACPQALRERFVVLCPQCPADPERGDGSGIWLRKGYYEHSSYMHQVEVALAELLEAVLTGLPDVDRRRVAVTGTSMGAYASLELPLRWPGFFSAAAPVAAHYDLDPMDVLVERLSEPHPLPLWFFHAKNDSMCPYEPILSLVRQLRVRSRAEVHLTAFEDTWSVPGHCADRVAYWTRSQSPDQEAFGQELFDWLAQQEGPGLCCCTSGSS